MLFLKGTRTARIKTYQHHENQCENCKDFDLTIGVFQDYYHVWFIPIVASGIKSSVIYCSSCGTRIRSNSLSKQYESKTRIPFYLYSGVILAGLLVLSALTISALGSHERSGYIADPKVGDVYLMKTKQDTQEGYYFIRLKQVDKDSVIAYDSHLMYLDFTSSFSPEDYFDTNQEVSYSKLQLKQWYKNDTIETIFRVYGQSTGFDRLK